ncbi:MarR family winged helix-turn-helix transcriptional regulator [Streptomyces avermitilis]|uniref:MarR family winged helix-turn-helix transcriptional regulator n=1 Tax=Streptomyces avermitilis TaxID=33903 RepID=UPI00339DB7E4
MRDERDDRKPSDAADAGRHPEAVARQIADAVENLVTLWTAAAEAVSPRLSAYQLKALRAVWHRSELNLTALADTLGIALPAASRLCDRLEAAGLLERTSHPRNRRELQLRVTPHGRRVLLEVAERRSRSLATVLAAMPPAQRTSLERGLHAFHEARARPGAGGDRHRRTQE